MKLYIENGEVIFDFSDVKDAEDEKDSVRKKFLRDTSCNWIYTNKWNVMRMDYEPQSWVTEYGNERQLEHFLSSCIYEAKNLGYIEVSPTVEKLLQKTAVRCKELYDAELAKEKERERHAEWELLCKSGCSGCKNLCRCGDDYFCVSSKEMLPKKNVPGVSRGRYVLFDYKPFPTDSCPFNVNQSNSKGVNTA